MLHAVCSFEKLSDIYTVPCNTVRLIVHLAQGFFAARQHVATYPSAHSTSQY